jgi:hypothetical protein
MITCNLSIRETRAWDAAHALAALAQEATQNQWYRPIINPTLQLLEMRARGLGGRTPRSGAATRAGAQARGPRVAVKSGAAYHKVRTNGGESWKAVGSERVV